MSIQFQCESCKRRITAPDSFAGKRGKCPYCGQVVTALAAAPPKAEAAPKAAAPPAPTPRAPAPEAPEPTQVRSGLFETPWPGAGAAEEPARTSGPSPWTATGPTDAGAAPPEPPAPPPPPARAPASVQVGAELSSLKESLGGCMSPQLFAGEFYVGRNYYLAGSGNRQKQVLQAIGGAVQQRGPKDLRVTVQQAKVGMGSAPRDVIAVRWSIGYGYVVCFAPGQDLFVSVRIHYQPGCIARLLALTPWFKLEPNIFGVDDLNMLAHCVMTTVEEQLDAMQLSYLSSE